MLLLFLFSSRFFFLLLFSSLFLSFLLFPSLFLLILLRNAQNHINLDFAFYRILGHNA
jgi:hypothetical protein